MERKILSISIKYRIKIRIKKKKDANTRCFFHSKNTQMEVGRKNSRIGLGPMGSKEGATFCMKTEITEKTFNANDLNFSAVPKWKHINVGPNYFQKPSLHVGQELELTFVR